MQKLVNTHGIIGVADLTTELGVTEMTIRRDLKELEEEGLIQRIHGGAKLPKNLSKKELSHSEKQEINTSEKIYIAKQIASLIESDDTIFLGPGTTIEMVYDYLQVTPMRVVTNSIHVFNKFNQSNMYDLILIGGSYRERTGAFVGSIANQALSKLRVRKAFIGVNGINHNNLFTSNEEEGTTQSIIMDNAQETYIVADHSKIAKEDFFSFYDLDKTTAIITDENLTTVQKQVLEQYTRVIN
ncbi:DeoR/GlpR family DNA-binding transcription regulator [Atopococcus tabaci]|uniref:DeoR/GlpR family DNA-binding transcription regulator n=1 Tax=Atopococcus tabaci TaxID=269774 RepID=UPI0023E46647|nr:DeoR/GlpR family DNA-binding transcription regulator [Atopococcus tabaci]